MGPKGFLTITVEVIRSFLQDLKGLREQKFLKKRQSFQRRNYFGLIFLPLSVVMNHRDGLKESKRYFDKYCGSCKTISLGPKRLLKTKVFD